MRNNFYIALESCGYANNYQHEHRPNSHSRQHIEVSRKMSKPMGRIVGSYPIGFRRPLKPALRFGTGGGVNLSRNLFNAGKPQTALQRNGYEHVRRGLTTMSCVLGLSTRLQGCYNNQRQRVQGCALNGIYVCTVRERQGCRVTLLLPQRMQCCRFSDFVASGLFIYFATLFFDVVASKKENQRFLATFIFGYKLYIFTSNTMTGDQFLGNSPNE